MLSKKKNKKLAKTLNKIFSDESFILDLVSDVIKSRGYRIQEVQKRFGDILTYYISTRDTKVYKYQELKDILYDEIYGCRKSVCPKNIKRNEEESEALVRNIINEGVVTHSFNGFNLSRIKKYGLGTDQIYDDNLNKELDKLENDLGRSEYVKQQTNGSTEIYYTSPGANSIYYAMQQSPERLFHGPLRQEIGKYIPVEVGESKEDYYKRVAFHKIEMAEDGNGNLKYTRAEQQPIKANAEKVISKLCSSRPQIALIPINSSKYTLNASQGFAGAKTQTLKNHLENQAARNISMENWAQSRFFSNCCGGSCDSNCENLVSTGVHVPASELEFVSIPDAFDIAQIMAKHKGLKPGDKFDLISLKRVDEQVVEAHSQVTRDASFETKVTTILDKKNESKKERSPLLILPSISALLKLHKNKREFSNRAEKEYDL